MNRGSWFIAPKPAVALYCLKLKKSFIERRDAPFLAALIGRSLRGIPLFPVIRPIEGRVDVLRNVPAGEVEQQEDQGPSEVYGRNF